MEKAHRVERKPKIQVSHAPSLANYATGKREQVLRKTRDEKLSGIHISEDLAVATLINREPLIPKLRVAKEAEDRLLCSWSINYSRKTGELTQ